MSGDHGQAHDPSGCGLAARSPRAPLAATRLMALALFALALIAGVPGPTKAIQGASGAFGNTATRLQAFLVKGGTYVCGSYADALFAEQAAEPDSKRHRELLDKIAQLLSERTIYAPIWQLAFLNGAGPRVGEPGLGLIAGHAYSAAYEDVTLAGK